MRHRIALLLCALLGACAGLRPVEPPPGFLFRDDQFNAPAERFSASGLFSLSDSMREFLRNRAARTLRREGPVDGLIDALYREGELKLRYDPSRTRTAAEAFDARAGNCLSLVIMTAAFAKELGLEIQYNSAEAGEMWSRSAGLLLGSAHVNITLGSWRPELLARVYQLPQTVDFLPASEIGALQVREVPERTIVAMYMNNRAAEALVRADLDDAYGWARAAIRQDPQFASSYNTLAVVYLRHGNAGQAARVLRYELEREPDDATLISNLADVASRLGDPTEAAALRARLARIDPHPPYQFFDLGMQAMQRNDFRTASAMFAREVARAGYNHEFHFWLGVAYFRLGRIEQARDQLLQAIETSSSRGERDRYAAKLAWLKANGGGQQAPVPEATPFY